MVCIDTHICTFPEWSLLGDKVVMRRLTGREADIGPHIAEDYLQARPVAEKKNLNGSRVQ
jgi:hypothetical protein